MPDRTISREDVAAAIQRAAAAMQAARQRRDIRMARRFLVVLCRLEILAERFSEVPA